MTLINQNTPNGSYEFTSIVIVNLGRRLPFEVLVEIEVGKETPGWAGLTVTLLKGLNNLGTTVIFTVIVLSCRVVLKSRRSKHFPQRSAEPFLWTVHDEKKVFYSERDPVKGRRRKNGGSGFWPVPSNINPSLSEKEPTKGQRSCLPSLVEPRTSLRVHYGFSLVG